MEPATAARAVQGDRAAPDQGRPRYENVLPEKELREQINAVLWWRRYTKKYGALLRIPDDVTVVRQACFGALTSEIKNRFGIGKLETAGLGTCVTLILIGSEPEVIMAHVDSEREDSIDAILCGRKSPFERAVVVYSDVYDERSRWYNRGVKPKVLAFARAHAAKVEELEVASSGVGVTLEGVVYETLRRVDESYDLSDVTQPYLKIQWMPRTEAEVRRIFSKDPNFERVGPVPRLRK